MVRTALLGLFLFGITAGLECRAEDVFVSLRPGAAADRAEIRLADIADIASRRPNNAEQLGSLVVAKCAGLARPCQLSQAGILPAVQARAAQLGINVVWGSNEAVTIRGHLHPVSLVPAIDLAAITILRQIDQGYPLAVSLKDGPDSIDVPPGTTEFRPEFDQLRWVGATIELPINVLVDGSSVAKPIVHYTLKRGAVSARPATVQQSFDDQPLPSVGRAAVAAPKAQPAAEHHADDIAVAKNKRVKLLIGSGPLRIEAEGIALADAGLGGMVSVRRANGLADIRGRAIDRETVLVEEN